MHQQILILDFGSQVTQLIARRLRELNVYCEIHPWNKIPEISAQVKGVILSGSPFSVHQEGAPMPDLNEIYSKYPVLGICYGAQLMAIQNDGAVVRSTHREYGRALLNEVDTNNVLMQGISLNSQVWMSHGDTIESAGSEALVLCSTGDVRFAGYQLKDRPHFGVQFHPEVYHSSEGTQLLKNFVKDICGCTGDWTPAGFVEETIVE